MLARNSGLLLPAGLVLFLGFAIAPWTSEPQRAAADIQISKERFARYIEEWSEQEGFFDSDNFLSNETSYLHVVNTLREQAQPGGVFIGVGPDQNFSYVVHTRPILGVIIDIRRQNMLQHLLFKALMDRASSRAEYLALLFSKDVPRVRDGAPLQDLLDAVRMAPSPAGLFEENLERAIDILIRKYGLSLSPEDLGRIEYVYRTFWSENLDLRFSTLGRLSAFRYPSYEEILLETDREGRYQSFLSSEDLFAWLKQFHAENRLIPIVGDFAGPHAFKNVAAFLKQNGLTVSTFYTSNVEFYIFGRSGWQAYMDNVQALPVADDAVFIRSYFQTDRRHPLNVAGHRSTSLVHPILPFLREYRAGRLRTYWDIVKGY